MGEHEQALIRAFIRPESRRRLLELLGTPKGRKKLRASLAHFRDLDMRFAQLIPPAKQHPDEIEAALRSKGAPDVCHVISESAALDGHDIPLGVALGEIVGNGLGSFVSCIPGKLAYFESEEPGERYLLIRTV